MADEEVKIGLDTSGYEQPLYDLTKAMVAFNATAVTATAQQKQMAKIMAGTGRIFGSYAKILVQTAKATTIAIEGPSEALTKRFRTAQNVLRQMGGEVNKLSTLGEKVARTPILPKDLARIDEQLTKRVTGAFEATQKVVSRWRENVTQDVRKTQQEIAKGVVKGDPAKAQAQELAAQMQKLSEAEQQAAIKAAEVYKDAEISKYNALKNRMEIQVEVTKNTEKAAANQLKEQVQAQKAADDVLAKEVAVHEKQKAQLDKTAADATKYWDQREREAIEAIQAEAQAVVDAEQAKYNSQLNTMEIEASRLKVIKKLDAEVAKGLAVEQVKKDAVVLEQSFKRLTKIDIGKLQPRQQEILRDALTQLAKGAQTAGLSIQQLEGIWGQYVRGTLKVNDQNRQAVSLLNNLESAHDRARIALDQHARRWQRLGQLVFARILTSAFYNFLNAIRSNITATLDLSKALGEIQTISHDMPLAYDEWRKALRELSDEYNFVLSDIAEATYQTISNQIGQGRRAIDFMKTAADFARITASTMQESVDLLSAALNSFKLPATETQRVAAELFKTVEQGRVKASDMNQTLGRSAILAHQAGVSFEEYLSMIQIFTISGLRFDRASTFMINVINKLMKPSAELNELFKEWGVTSGQMALQFYGLSGVLRKLFEATSGELGELAEYFHDIRGTTGVAGLMANLDRLDLNIRETVQSSSDYLQALQETTRTTGYIITKEANIVRNVFLEQMMMTEDLLARLNHVFERINTSVGQVGGAVLPSAIIGILGTVSTRLLAQTFGVRAAIGMTIGRIGGFITALITVNSLLSTYLKNLNSYNRVAEVAKKSAEALAVGLNEINSFLIENLRNANRERARELGLQQEREKLVLQEHIDEKKLAVKELLQLEKKQTEDQRQELKQRISDLERANKDTEKYLEKLQQKYAEQLIEERKTAPGTTPFDRFEIELQSASNLFAQAMQKVTIAGTAEELRQAQNLFDSYMGQITDARKTAQTELGVFQPFEIDAEREAKLRQFIAVYRARQKEIKETELPALREQLTGLNKEIKTYADVSTVINKALEQNIIDEKTIIALLRAKNGQKAVELALEGKLGESFREALALLERYQGVEQEQIKARQAIEVSEVGAQRVAFGAFIGQMPDMVKEIARLSKMLYGDTDAAKQVAATSEQLRRTFLETTKPIEQEAILVQQFPEVQRQAQEIGRSLIRQVVGGKLWRDPEALESIRVLSDILDAQKTTQEYITSGDLAAAIASNNDRIAKQTGSGQQLALEHAIQNRAQVPIPEYHKGGWVKNFQGGGTVPAYLQAGEYVIDKDTAAKWSEWEKWLSKFGKGDIVATYEHLQASYQKMLERGDSLRREWTDTEKSLSQSSASIGYSRSLRDKMLTRQAQNVVSGPDGTLNLAQMETVLNVLNAFPEMQQAYWDNRTTQLKDKYGAYQDQLRPQIEQLEARNQRLEQQYKKTQIEFGRRVNQGTLASGRSSYNEFVARGGDPRAQIVANQASISELQWLLGQVPETALANMTLQTISAKKPIPKMSTSLLSETLKVLQAEKAGTKKVTASTVLGEVIRWGRGAVGLGEKIEPVDFRGTKDEYLYRLAAAGRITALTAGIMAAALTGAGLAAPSSLLGAAGKTAAFGRFGQTLAPTAVRAITKTGQYTWAGRKLLSEYLVKNIGIPQIINFSRTAGVRTLLGEMYPSIPIVSKTMITGLKALWKPKVLLPLLSAGATGYWQKDELVKLLRRYGILSQAEYKAVGGFPGSPRGTDIIPAWLTPGEFVVNASAASRFHSLLEHINSFGSKTYSRGGHIGYFQEGGSVGGTRVYYNNNITINNPTGNPALDANRIVQEINRQQSRGTVRLRTA